MGMIIDLGYKAILDLLPCYLTIQDSSLRILHANHTFLKDFGPAVDTPCYQVYKKSAEKCSLCPVIQTFEDKKVHMGEEIVYLENGEAAHVIVYSAPILDVTGKVVAVVELSSNIDRIKEAQKELAFLGQSFAALSHEVKNMLEGVQGGAYVVEEALKDKDEELLQKGWSVVKRNIDELSSLVQNILYSAKKRQPLYEVVNPSDLVRQTVGLFQEKARSWGVDLTSQGNPKLPPVHLDHTGIRRMLGNLILNGLEACRKDPSKDPHHVIVRADYYDPEHFVFEVEDNGIGMDEGTEEKIFTEFFSTKGANGTGLGTFMVQKIAKEHGGRCEVLTAPGKGSTFRVILRIQQASPV